MPRATFTVRTTRAKEVIDFTDEVQGAVAEAGVQEGLACISAAHCTCAVYVNEGESGLMSDTLALAEHLTQRKSWRHDMIDDNAAAHLAASFMGSSVCLPVTGGAVELGTWQRILLVELDGPRHRKITVQIIEDQQ